MAESGPVVAQFWPSCICTVSFDFCMQCQRVSENIGKPHCLQSAADFFEIPCLGSHLFNSSHRATIITVKLVAIKSHITLLTSDPELNVIWQMSILEFTRLFSCSKLTQSVEPHGRAAARGLVLDFLLDVSFRRI